MKHIKYFIEKYSKNPKTDKEMVFEIFNKERVNSITDSVKFGIENLDLPLSIANNAIIPSFGVKTFDKKMCSYLGTLVSDYINIVNGSFENNNYADPGSFGYIMRNFNLDNPNNHGRPFYEYGLHFIKEEECLYKERQIANFLDSLRDDISKYASMEYDMDLDVNLSTYDIDRDEKTFHLYVRIVDMDFKP